jgi:hypothetical protein
MGKGLILCIVDKEVLGKGEELPERRNPILLSPHRNQEVERQHGEVSRQNAV